MRGENHYVIKKSCFLNTQSQNLEDTIQFILKMCTYMYIIICKVSGRLVSSPFIFHSVSGAHVDCCLSD